MTDTSGFTSWFASEFPDKETFEANFETFASIQDATHGWAAKGLMYVLNRALSFMDDNEDYLEIGTYGGRSVIAALKDNNRIAHVIDPFMVTGEAVRPSWFAQTKAFGIRDRICLHEVLAEEFDAELPPIGVFFYDGNHDSGHTYEALKKFEPFLADRAIIIVDDFGIHGGNNQTAYPGHRISPKPVTTDTERWLTENRDKATLFTVTPWSYEQAIITYERN